MAILCLDTSLEMLRALCCCRTLRLQRDLCHSLHKGSPQTLQAVVTLSTCHVLQNSPEFTVQDFEVCTPWKPIFGADESQKFPSQPLLNCLVPDETRLDWVDMFSVWDKIFCFQSGFWWIHFHTVLIAISVLTLFRCSDWALF